jgi:hypothetical protein
MVRSTCTVRSYGVIQVPVLQLEKIRTTWVCSNAMRMDLNSSAAAKVIIL